MFGSANSCLGPLAVISALRLIRRINPDIIVFSLWRTMAAFIAVRLLFPRKTVVSMLHSDRAVHFADRFWTVISTATADSVWADSDSSLKRVTGGNKAGSRRVVSFVNRRLTADEKPPPTPSFICWARLTNAKNFPLALELIDRLRRRFPDVSFDIIGPDGGELSVIRAKIESLGLRNHVHVHGASSIEDIADMAKSRSFFLQLSKYEGMAMSVVEAMQLGLVPVVTPVGEPARYCSDMENAVVFSSIDQAVTAISRLIDFPDAYAKMSAAAVATWSDAPIYADDFVAAARELLGGGVGNAPD